MPHGMSVIVAGLLIVSEWAFVGRLLSVRKIIVELFYDIYWRR